MARLLPLISCFTLLALIASCQSVDEISITNTPFPVSSSTDGRVDLGPTIRGVQNELDNVLPGAYMTIFTFTANCEDLSNLRGKMAMRFVKSQWMILRPRVFVADVSVDTISESIRVDIKDDTEHYPSVEPLTLDEGHVQITVAALQNYLESSNRCDGRIALTLSTSGGPWRVRCADQSDQLTRCLEIDPITGGITELK
jgi:hypothetical protein